ncbi:MAG: BadF/BadG/BcrA/BcrD ATPase family protein [Polyangiales bacterium]
MNVTAMSGRGHDEPPWLGIDAGSTTLKAVVVAPHGRVARASIYLRHHGDLARCLDEAVGRVARDFDGVRAFVTGTAGQRIAERLGAPHLHEVPAVLAAVRARHPEAATVLDLGGQDAKLARLDRGPDGAVRRIHSAMNDRCAAGTGVTIERCLARLGVSSEAARAVRYDPAQVRPVSSKCGVFAETDLVNLARAGASLDALVMSLADAVVRQNLAVLARGVALDPAAVLLGGVVVHLPALADAWAHHLGVAWRARGLSASREGVIVPDEALFYGALGACILGDERGVTSPVQGTRALASRLSGGVAAGGHRAPEPPIARDDDEARAALDAWGHGPSEVAILQVDPAGASIGIDAGSTVFKAVALGPRGEVLARSSRESRDPVTDARELVRAVEGALAAAGWRVRAIGVTGYGAGLVAPVVGADLRVLETVAHARAARELAPDADAVCDVGGQDVKVLALDASGSIRDFRLSSQCDAGLGLALEATARELGVALGDVAARALAARRAPRFGDGCVVFLDADRVTFLRQGWTIDEVLAGVVRALPRLVWERIAHGIFDGRRPRVVVLQGGVHRNAAAALAQREHLTAALPGVRVRVHPFCAEAGAIGAAYCARDAVGERARGAVDARPAVVRATTQMTRDTRCSLCASGCARTFIELEMADGARERHVAGNGCEAGAERDVIDGRRLARRKLTAVPNLLGDEARTLFAPRRGPPPLSTPPRRVRIGVPRALSMYRAAPFFRAYLEALGVRSDDVVFSPFTDARLWREGAGHGATDPCFPVKVTLAHAHHLLARVHRGGRRLDAILAPRSTHASIPVRHGRDCASCPVVEASPVMLRAAFAQPGGAFEREGIRLLDGPVTLTDPPRLRAQLHAMFGELLSADRASSDGAVERGFAAMRAVDEALRDATAAVLDRIGRGRAEGPAAVLVLCRPYHADPGINHRVGEELQSLGYPTITIRGLPRDDGYLRGLMAPDLDAGVIEDPFDVRDLCDDATNSGGLERLWAARFAARHERLGVVDLSSFKCAQDPPLERATRRVLDDGAVVTCALRDLDETRPVTSLRVRLATFAHAMRARGLRPWTS